MPYIHVRDNSFYAFFGKYSFIYIKVGFLLFTHSSYRHSYIIQRNKLISLFLIIFADMSFCSVCNDTVFR